MTTENEKIEHKLTYNGENWQITSKWWRKGGLSSSITTFASEVGVHEVLGHLARYATSPEGATKEEMKRWKEKREV